MIIVNCPVEVIFATTQNYLPYYLVLGRSIACNMNGRALNIHVLFTRGVYAIPDDNWKKYIDCAKNTFSDIPNVRILFHDITDKMSMFDGQNVGMWGSDTSLTHYIYLLAPIVLPKSVRRAIYMDGDMICNTNLGDVFDMDMHGTLVAMAQQSTGDDVSERELSPDASNSGFIMMNLDAWRKRNTLDDILDFGRKLHKTSFCDQALMYFYFAKNHPDDIMYIDKSYNMFPTANPDVATADIRVLHFTSFKDPKPWNVLEQNAFRGADIWWKYARQTPFWEDFVHDIIVKNVVNMINSQFNDVNIKCQNLEQQYNEQKDAIAKLITQCDENIIRTICQQVVKHELRRRESGVKRLWRHIRTMRF